MSDLRVLLDVLAPDGPLSACHQYPGAKFVADVLPPEGLLDAVSQHLKACQWMSIAVVDEALIGSARRGDVGDVRRLLALPNDFDVKPGAFADAVDAQAAIDSLAELLECQPAAVVATGHGFQAWWILDSTDEAWRSDGADDPRLATMVAVVRRWGRLVRMVCDRFGASMDAVFDLARVQRMPGSINVKDPGNPVEVVTEWRSWRPLTMKELVEVLDAYGIPEERREAGSGGIVLPATEWAWAEESCTYAQKVIEGFAGEEPGGSGRHPWLLGKMTRIAAMHRYGCLTEADHERALVTVAERFRTLLQDPDGPRDEGYNEIHDAITFGTAKVEGWSQPRLVEEFTPVDGSAHRHLPPLPAWRSSLTPEREPTKPAPARRMIRLRAASTFRMQRTEWLWADRMPVGALALLAGREGLGKSLLWVWMAAELTQGRLPGAQFGNPTDVVIVIGEDSLERTVGPRLRVAGADLDRVHVADVLLPEGWTDQPVLPLDIDQLGNVVADSGARLVVLDPLVSVVQANLDTHRDNETRRALEPLARMADDTGAAILGLVHHNKGKGDAGDRVIGSRAFVATARTVLSVASSQQDEGSRLVAVTKANLGRTDLPALAFTVAAHTVTDESGLEFPVPTIVWHGETEECIADALDGSPLDSEERDERDAMATFLTDFVTQQGGEAAARDVEKALRAVFSDVSKSTIKRARARAGIKTRKAGMSAGWVWCLDPTTSEDATKNPKVPPVGTLTPSNSSEPSLAPSGATSSAADPSMGPCAGCSTQIRRYGAASQGSLCPTCSTESMWMF